MWHMTDWWGDHDGFVTLCEIEPATTPDLRHVRRQIALLDGVVDACLVPDNHLGRATVSSIAVAGEVTRLGGRAVACVNSRDRNLLGFRRDLLTAAAYGVSDFLFVRGDDVEGARSGDLTVRRMIDEARGFDQKDFRIGVTARAGQPLPEWKRAADFVVVQMAFDLEPVIQWRKTIDFDGPVLAGVVVLTSSAMARRFAASVPEVSIPEALITRLETDTNAGVDHALELVSGLRSSGGVDGVHLVPVTRVAQVAERLSKSRRS
jgi:methylenetetrahydrofolate reductase (NADPH)